MSNALKLRRGTAAQTATFVGAASEVTVVTDDYSLRVHDGTTAGGHPITGAGATNTLATIAALRAYTGTVTPIYVACHHTTDIGGGWFNLITTDTTTADDNGMIIVDSSSRRWKRPFFTEITPQMYGAVVNGSTDDSAAIIAADTYAGANYLTLRMTSGTYRWTRATGYIFTSRHILGDPGETDGGGTTISFAPAVTMASGATDIPASTSNDLLTCMALNAQKFVVENISIQGVSGASPSTLVSGGYLTPANLPAYSAFAPGFVAFSTVQGATGTFINCTSGRIKVGLLLNSTEGHISWKECTFSGTFGVYCLQNTEDYWAEGGGMTGAFAGMIFGNTIATGHYGGLAITMMRVHLGYSPYVAYQVNDSPTAVPSYQTMGGLYGAMYSCSFEQIGEAAFQFLDKSLTALVITRSTSDFSDINDTNYVASWITAANRQANFMRFGWIEGMSTLQCEFDKSPQATVAGAAAAYVVGMQPTQIGRDWFNLDAFSTVTYAPSVQFPAGLFPKQNPVYLPDFVGRGSDMALKGDLKLKRSLLNTPNLIKNPEVVANWTVYSGAVISVNTLAAMNTANAFTGFTFPRNFYEELGNNPNILTYTNTTTNSGQAQVHFPASFVEPNRYITVTYWYACRNPSSTQSQLRAFVSDNNGNNVYDSTVQGIPNLTWIKATCVANQNTNFTYQNFSFNVNNLDASAAGLFYLAGLMITYDDVAPYNPNLGATVIGAPYFDSQTTKTTVGAAGSAAALPTAPAGYLPVFINGVTYEMPYYTSG